MKMNKKVIFLVIICVLILLFMLWLFVPGIQYADRICMGNKVIKKIEKFKSISGRLPDNLEEIEVEEGPIYYNKCRTNQYVLWFGTTLGESYTYGSKNRKWKY